MVEPEEEQIRKDAVKLHLEGTSVTEVCSDIGRSRQWLYKWLRRYQGGDAEWYAERSRAPQEVANRTPRKVEKRVLE
ncbi:MAG: helix-turn-helix domain-containing protein, partial [Candidatus Eisenbacteria sp.]|nr:helix-turn-helix domain-containing protein [Candidatus Eisenbacteria bacterium]